MGPKRDRPGRPPDHPPVCVFETGETYETYLEAAESVGCSRWGVMRCCKGVQAATRGFHFYFDMDASSDWIGKYADEDLWYLK